MTSKPEQVADERLIASHDLAIAALREITAADSIGPAAGYVLEDDGAVSLRFHTRLAGYPGWYWTVSVAVVEESEPTVLEVELLPGDGALLAPDWVPWATRLADYQAAQAAAAPADDSDEDDLDEDDSDEDDLDDDELDDDGDESDDDDEEQPKARFHAGDLDGVDIDELDDDSASAPGAGRRTPDADDDEDADDDDSDDVDNDSDDDDNDEEDDVHGGGDRSY